MKQCVMLSSLNETHEGTHEKQFRFGYIEAFIVSYESSFVITVAFESGVGW